MTPLGGVCVCSCCLVLSASVCSAAQDELRVRAVAGAKIMKYLVPAPEKLKIQKAIVTAKGDICYEFRFPKAEGGIAIQKAVLPVKGERLLIPLSSTYQKAWNQKCAGKKGEDVVDYLRLAVQ